MTLPTPPDTIVVLGHDISVRVVDRLVLPDQAARYDSHTSTIELDATMAPGERYDTLLHEVLHAIDHTLQLGMTHKTVWRLGASITDTMRRNPDLVRYLMDGAWDDA